MSTSDRARTQPRRIEKRGSGHLLFRPPNQTNPLVVISSSLSDHRALANMRSQLWRAGLRLGATSRS